MHKFAITVIPITKETCQQSRVTFTSVWLSNAAGYGICFRYHTQIKNPNTRKFRNT